jgi:hypothetical protein
MIVAHSAFFNGAQQELEVRRGLDLTTCQCPQEILRAKNNWINWTAVGCVINNLHSSCRPV